ncbi:MAG: DUF5686 and carboxypeptidase regulatory-like domain-containing protein [Prevotellaceae bacterium]|jgi:hypothetical protein|nr:DUF5686 and carboxypeptidase regulatory-like domain-containing protein [Prevotellaceae bacterium]
MYKREICILTTLLLCVFASGVQAQILRGKVTDNEGNPVPGAVLFIREISQGIATDNSGEFQISLKEGNYTCEFSSLGYEKQSVNVTVDKPLQSVTVSLKEKVYELKEIVISPRREDPAYAIMRRAIAMAPYYLHQVKSYESEIYLKGSMKINKMARWIESRVDEVKAIKGSLLLMESHNEVVFTSPDKYEQKVIAVSSSFPKEMIDEDSPMGVATASIYSPTVRGMISPLSPGAFTYYRFVLEGKSAEGDHVINRIRIEPKKKSPMLLSGGRLYIISNSWNVRNLELNSSIMGVNERFTVNYSEVKPSVFLPVAYTIEDSINIGIIGLDAEIKYYSSIKYRKIEINGPPANIPVNENIPVSATDTLTKKTKSKKQLKAEKELEELSSKDNLSNRDAYKLAGLMLEKTEPEESKQKRESLEISGRKSNVQVTVDSLARSRDSVYWSQIRSLPLQIDEVVSYRKKDSLDIKFREIRLADSSDGGSKSWFGKLINGSQVNFSKNYRLRYGGLLNAVPEYNFTDGVWLGQRLVFEGDLSKKHALLVSPSAYWATARKTVNWQIAGVFRYAPSRNGRFAVSGGNSTFDFNRIGGGSRMVNSIFSLVYAENSVKFFQRQYIEASHRIDAANGFFVKANVGYEKRSALENNMSYNFFGKTPSPNLPDGQLTPMPDNTLTGMSVQLEYTPRYRYRIRDNGRKQYVSSKYPTFTLNYEKGIPTDSNRSASFDKAEFSIHQEISFNAFNRLEYLANTGTFLSSKRVYFPDFKHSNSNELFFTTNPLRNSFCMANYRYSTDKSWFQMHLNYTSSYLFIKNLPFLQKYLFEEAVYARTLFIPGTNYSELGYSVGLFKALEAGVFVGFEKGRYDAVGFTLSLPLNF